MLFVKEEIFEIFNPKNRRKKDIFVSLEPLRNKSDRFIFILKNAAKLELLVNRS